MSDDSVWMSDDEGYDDSDGISDDSDEKCLEWAMTRVSGDSDE